jgi:hypothetical protein
VLASFLANGSILRYIGLLVIFFVLVTAAPPSHSASKKEETKPGKAVKLPEEVIGWRLIYKHHLIGMMQVDISPIGGKVMTGFMNACIHGTTDKDSTVFVFNPDSKTYYVFTPDSFKTKMSRIYKSHRPPDWHRELKNVGSAESILGHVTQLSIYSLVSTVHPEIRYPDKIWSDPSIPTPGQMKHFVATMMNCPDGIPGVPLRMSRTMKLNPLVTEDYLEVTSIEKRKFKAADFEPPLNYKRTTDDSQLVDFGTLPLAH